MGRTCDTCGGELGTIVCYRWRTGLGPIRWCVECNESKATK